MKTTYIVVGLIIIAAIVAIIYVMSQPRGSNGLGTLGTGNVTNPGAAGTVAGIGNGLVQVGTSIAGAVST